MDRIIKKKWKSKHGLNLVYVVSAIVALLFVIIYFDSSKSIKIVKQSVTISKVSQGEFAEQIPLWGKVYPKNTISIDAVQGGIVQQINTEDGQLVSKGEVLIKLQNAEMELRFMEQETRIFDAINNLQRTQLNLERDKYMRQKEIVSLRYRIDKLKTDFERKKTLYDKEVIAPQEFEDATRNYNESLDQVELSLKLAQIDSVSYTKRNKHINSSIGRMYSNLDLLNKNFNRLQITSPASGILSSFQLEMGQTVNPGQRIGQIDMKGGALLKARIDERYAAIVHKGQEAVYKYDGRAYNLKINKIYTTVNNGTFQADLIFDEYNEPTHIKRGQSLQLLLSFSFPEKVVLLDKGDFFSETGGNWVFVIDKTGKHATKRKIILGRQNSRCYEVIEGLSTDEEVIVSSYERFSQINKLILK